jgi:hypothetical protein
MKTITRSFLLFTLTLLLAVPMFGAATITIINNDGPGEGFNETTAVAPVGGNPMTTRGAQRLYAFTHAANIWAQSLDSNVNIVVQAQFNPLAPNVLGSAGATFVFRDFGGVPPFPGAAFASTWYSGALADKRAGTELGTVGVPDLNATFSSNFNFYLGVDNNHGPLNDLVAVLLHELGHGLGFQNFVTETTGSNFSGFTDVYSQFTLDTTNNMLWSSMTNAQRAASATRWGSVVWNGPAVTAAVPSVLSFGAAEVRVLAPASVARDYQFGTAGFGAAVGSPNVIGSVVAAVDPADGAGPATTDGCSPFTNAAAIAGNIAIIERGTCGFTVKVKNAQDAGAVAAIIYNNAANAGAAAPGMATDPIIGPTITITGVSLTRADGLALVGASGVSARIGVDNTVRAGADANGLARLYAPSIVALGSSLSHYDTVARRNLLMEPAINADLTHSLTPPEDLTLPLMRDIGWFADPDLDGIASEDDNCPNTANADQANYDGDGQGDVCDNDDDNDGVDDATDVNDFSNMQPTVTFGSCDSGSTNAVFPNGETIMDRVAAITAKNHGDFASQVAAILNEANALGLITGAEKGAAQSCAAKN